MTVLKNKVSFERLLNLMKSINIASGSFLLENNTKNNKTLKDFVLKSTVSRSLFSFTLLIISTLIVTDFKLISIILCCSVGTSIYGLHGALFCYVYNKDIVKNLLKWCENIYNVADKYHKLIHGIAKTQLMKTETKATKCLKLLRIIFYVDSFGVTFGFAVVGLFLPENIYPKFSPPLPFYLPFKNQKSWMSFGCTTLFQTMFAIDTATLTILMYGLIFCIFIHILDYLNIIQEAAEMMKQDILTTSSDTISFNQCVQVLNEMICDVNSAINSAKKLLSFPFFFLELAGFGSLFICGLLFTVVHEQYFFAIGINVVCSLLFIICFINEKIMEKFENINKILYDIPWYNLPPKQRKSLMMLMHCDKIQKGLIAAKVHYMTFERFGLVIKAGYTNLLILKDLVQK